LADIPLEKAFSVEEQEELYAIAFQLYELGNYLHAGQFFKKLVLCNPFAEKYWRGLASCHQMQKEYLAAVHAWTSSALLEGNDPLPHFHAAECLFSLEQKEEALQALKAAESLLAHNEQHNNLRNKITLLKQVHRHAS
jgi:type III secretion system low calcium response chaperone LcrH/SycD